AIGMLRAINPKLIISAIKVGKKYNPELYACIVSRQQPLGACRRGHALQQRNAGHKVQGSSICAAPHRLPPVGGVLELDGGGALLKSELNRQVGDGMPAGVDCFLEMVDCRGVAAGPHHPAPLTLTRRFDGRLKPFGARPARMSKERRAVTLPIV